MTKKSEKGESSGGGCGCLTLILFCLLVWALLFGITINGKHYGISCGTDKGVEIK